MKMLGTVFIGFSSLSTLIVSGGQAQTNYDLSKLPNEGRMQLNILVDRPSNRKWPMGIYPGTAKEKVVAIDQGFVETVGAGVFFASMEDPFPAVHCYLFVRRPKRSPDLASLPVVGCYATNVWFSATVVEDSSGLESDGSISPVGLARPTNGALTSVGFRSKAMVESTTFKSDRGTSFASGRISVETLGELEVFVRPYISTGPNAMELILVVSPEQVSKLASMLPPGDSNELIRNLSRSISAPPAKKR